MILFKEFVLRLSKAKNLSSSLVNIFLLINWKKENKFQVFKYSILDEEFLTELDKEILMDLYISVVNLMNKLKSIVRIYKYKKAVKYNVDTDLHLNPLELLPENQKILILENNTLYDFKLKDLLGCWKIALLNSQGLFSKPFALKNPYTNIPLKINNLYNIYFKCLNIYINLPPCITNFFKCNMNLDKFQIYYYTFLKEVAINNFTETNNYYELFEQVLNLLHDYRKEVNYITFTNYCAARTRVKAVKLFRPLLLNYLLSKYSCNPVIKEEKKRVLKLQIIKLNNTTTDFGFERGFEVMRYVPLSERPITTQPPPPPTETLISRLRNRRNRLRRRQNNTETSFTESDSDDISDSDIVENVSTPTSITNISFQENNPINIVIPPPPPVINATRNIPPPPPPVINATRNIQTPTVLTRPINPPPPPPNVNTETNNTVNIVNPFVSTNEIPRTPVRNNSRQSIAQMNNNLRFNLVNSNHVNGLNFFR
tara:strand:+ start:3964 stop:5415 length:1452 start_codon:yes stop_codon:yes gene_type:complete